MSAPVLPTGLAEGWTLPGLVVHRRGRFWPSSRERIFARSWQYVGRADQVAKPGDFFASRAGHIPVAVVRDEEGELGGFVNVCRHRGHEVVSGEGNRRTLQCPYHAWTYGLDGCLQAVPRREREPDLPMEELSLHRVQVDTWGPLRLREPRPRGRPARRHARRRSGRGSRDRIRPRRARVRRALGVGQIASNWKVAIENYLECYHCPDGAPWILRSCSTSIPTSTGSRPAAGRPRSGRTFGGDPERRPDRRLRPARWVDRGAVPPRLAEPHGQRRGRRPQPRRRRLVARRPGPHGRRLRPLVRARGAEGAARGDDRVRQARWGSRTTASASPSNADSRRAWWRAAGSCARASS